MDFINSINVPKLKKSQARVIIIGALVLCLVGLILFALSRSFFDENTSIVDRLTGESDTEGDIPKVYILEGGPRIRLSEDITKTIGDGESFGVGNTVSTDSGSVGLIVFSDNSYVLVDNNTEVSLLEDNKVDFDGRIYFRNNSSDEMFITSGDYSVTSSLSRGSFSLFDSGLDFLNVLGNSTISNSSAELVLADDEILTLFSENLDTSSLSTYVTNYDVEESQETFWEKYYQCIDAKVSSALVDGRDKNKNSLKGRVDELLGCRNDVESEIFAALELENRKSLLSNIDEDEDEQEVENTLQIVSIQDGGIFVTNDSISCTWTSTGEVTGYEYSIGSSAGSTDILEWTETDQTSFEQIGLGLVGFESYFCNVRALSDSITSSIATSDGVIYDPSTGTISLSDYPVGQVSGSFNYSNLDDTSQIVISIYVKDSEGKFYDGVEWVDQIVWHDTTLVDVNPTITWTSTTNFAGEAIDYTGGVVFVQVKNNFTGKIISQITSNIP